LGYGCGTVITEYAGKLWKMSGSKPVQSAWSHPSPE
jgi:hypothetical protein